MVNWACNSKVMG
uniref:Uncharacterized protein n=1 Tax=Anguilla anguilla TaxID=7936 RepID=A0A0E9TA78_ANGAN